MIAAALIIAFAAPDTVPWRAQAAYGFEAFTGDRGPWQAATAIVTRRVGRHTLQAEVNGYRRFDLTDVTAGVEGYIVLAPRTYVDARVLVGPGAEVMARRDVGAELFRGVGRGWEVSAGYRHADYAATDVGIAAVSAAKYTGDWYLRARLTSAFQSGRQGPGLSLLGRRTFATGDDLAEVQGGAGQEIVTLGPGSVDVAATAFVAARWQRRVSARWGYAVSGSWNRQEGIPDRAGLTLGLFSRW